MFVNSGVSLSGSPIQQNEDQAIHELRQNEQTTQPRRSECDETMNVPPTNLKTLSRERKLNAEKTVISQVLRETHYNRKVTAERLQISSKALFNKIHQYGLAWKQSQPSGEQVHSGA